MDQATGQPGAAPDNAANPSNRQKAKRWLDATTNGVFAAATQASPAPGPSWATFPPKPPRVKAKWTWWMLILVPLATLMAFEVAANRAWTGWSTIWVTIYLLLVSACFAATLTRLGRGPLSAWRWQTAILALLTLGTGQWDISIAAIVVYYVVLLLVGRFQEPTILVGVGVISTALAILAIRPTSPDGTVGVITLVVLPLFVGRLLGTGAASRGELTATKVALSAQSEQAAVLAERARIARDLHDVVAHHMSMIAIQAEAAELRTPDLPDGARQSFELIRQAAKDALTETRSIVGLLRSDSGDSAERAPAPNFDSLAQLITDAQSGGVKASLEITGEPHKTTAATGLAAYRIVQESLANAARHAPGQPVKVQLNWLESNVEVTVLSGPVAALSSPAASTAVQATSQDHPGGETP